MKLSPRNSEEPDVNLTPMIDVVFLLLLFFMVSTSFIRESSLKVDLPEATGQALVEQEQAIDIVINSDGQFVVNTITLDSPSNEQLAAVLKKAVGENTDPHIIISADANAEYQNIVTAMDTAQQLGYTRLTLATRQTTSKQP
ncbi:MAG: biopolymer transporter ExbD [Gammaproteobacteria bacterium]|nr:MAG: biopolymer transporter ExbD [Gammaproteobacteria bacterium]RKZ98890.1 MAG: biopolymer transporter ExbD [Gammaproteobacteria bacterium]